MASYQNAKAAADYIKKKVHQTPQVGIICGSGLGTLAEIVSDPIVIKYSDIKQFPKSTVVGHAGNLVFGTLAGKNVVVMQGRFHPYEGYQMCQVTLPVRVMKLLGVETLIVTNAAGGLNPDYKVGDLMIIKDHINLLGMAGLNPLVGPNDERFGPRFPAMTDTYTKELREIAKAVGKEMQIEDFLREGVYVAEMGPTYETIAEARFLKMIGADAAGMSTAHEAIVAKHANMKVFAFSLITNEIVVDEDSKVVCNHEEVLQISAKRTEVMKTFVMQMLEKM
ncbi:Purine nucleoside phosphorylase [Taenia solium]|eukprot:TsM_000909900 transcript=TsM_000909900 gene=TsM_000909900